MAWKRTVPVLLVISAMVVALVPSTLQEAQAAGADGTVAFGAYPRPRGEAPQGAVEALEGQIGRPLDIVREYLTWEEDFPTSYHTWIADTGRTPMISLKPRRNNGTRIQWSALAAASPGSSLYDEVVDWAQKFKSYEVPLYFTFHHEPETSGDIPYGTDSDYKAAWRNVIEIFRTHGVDNAEFLFVTTAWNYQVNPDDRRYAPKWYPGDAWVDAIGADAYNWYNCLNANNTNWRTLQSVIEPFRQWGATHPDKPLMLPEWGSAEDPADPDRKGQWIAQAQELFKQPGYEQFTAVVYFNSQHNAECQWWVDSSPAALSAFAAMGADPFYNPAGAPVVGVRVDKAASASSVIAPGADIEFTVRVTNESPTETVSLDVLDDSVFGELNGLGSCEVPQTIAAGDSYVCSFTEFVGGIPGDTHVNTVMASGTSNDSPVSDSDDATVGVTAAPTDDVLFVVGDVGLLSVGEVAVLGRLESLGFAVVVESGASVVTGDAAGKALVVVSSNVSEWAVGSKFTYVSEPVIIWKPWLFDAMEMSGTNGSNRTVTAVDVVDGSHPLAAGFSGLTTILSPGSRVAVGTPSGGGTVVATAAGVPTLFVFAAGDVLDNGVPAPGCRIGYPAFHVTPPNYTADGWALFDNAVAWAVAGCSSAPASVPGAPTGVSAVGGDGSAQVSWTPPTDTGGSPITGYTVTGSPGGVSVLVGGGVTAVNVSGLINGTSYTFTVVATNGVGDSSPSEPSNPITPQEGVNGLPNVLVIVTDDQRDAAATMSVMPKTQAWLGDGGTEFTNSFVATPNCCPARGTLMSGRYSHNTGVQTQGDGDRLDQATTLQAYLQDAGYFTATIGKFLNQWSLQVDPPNFDHWAVLAGDYYNRPWNLDGTYTVVPDYTTTFMGEKAVEYLGDFETIDDNRPWYMYIATIAPHSPFTAEPKYENATVPAWPGNPAVNGPVWDKPPFMQWRQPLTQEEMDERRIPQMRTLMSVDDMVDTVLSELAATGELDNTLVIYTSDNGNHWGEFRFVKKWLPYTASIEVPLFMRWPGRFGAGVEDDRMVVNVDVGTTILEAADITPDPTTPVDGRSLLESWTRTRVLTEHWWDEYNAPASPSTWASIRTSTYQYVENYLDDGSTFREYYNLLTDPWQLVNVLMDGNPGNDPNVAALSALLAQDRACVGTACP